jgi:hypothetical protein
LNGSLVRGLSDEQMLDHDTWQRVETIVKTEMMKASLADPGQDRLVNGGTLAEGEDQYLINRFTAMRAKLAGEAATPVTANLPASGPGHP